MKSQVVICLMVSNIIFGQQDYYSLYKQITDSVRNVSKITDAQYKLMDNNLVLADDTAGLNRVFQKQRRAYNSTLLPLYQKLIHKTFPDISFTDQNFVTHNLSDFSNKKIILNYNYLYCQPCMNRIDSTLKIIESGRYHVIVLLKEFYRKEIDDLLKYGDKITVGFITQETAELISFEAGDDKFYLLNSKRIIEYFDAMEPYDYQAKWLKFLRAFHENE